MASEINRKKHFSALKLEAGLNISVRLSVSAWGIQHSAPAWYSVCYTTTEQPLYCTVGVFNQAPVEPFILGLFYFYLILFVYMYTYLHICIREITQSMFSCVWFQRCSLLHFSREKRSRQVTGIIVPAQLYQTSIQLWKKCETHDLDLTVEIFMMQFV